jgi:hypothetical protein
LLRSAKETGLSVEGDVPTMLCPYPFQGATTADYRMSWQLSRIWSWDDSEVGPVSLFLAIGFYGKITVYLSQSRLTALTRHISGSVFTVHVDYGSGRETLFRGSLGRGANVCTMPFPLWFKYSYLSALWPPPYIWSLCSYRIQWK